MGGPVRVDPEAAAPVAVRRTPFAVAPAIVLVCASAPTAPLLEETPDLLRADADPPSLHTEHATQEHSESSIDLFKGAESLLGNLEQRRWSY